MNRQRGFTLIEMLLATSVLAAGLVLGLAALHAATVSVQRAEAIAADSEQVRAVQGFLRSRLKSAMAISFGEQADGGQALRFVGEPERMAFVADLPAYLGRGGPSLHELALHDDGDGPPWLGIGFATVLAGQVIAEPAPRAPELLLDDVREFRLRYRGRDDTGQPGVWSEWWDAVDRLPLQVEIVIVSASSGPWPALVVSLPKGGGG